MAKGSNATRAVKPKGDNPSKPSKPQPKARPSTTEEENEQTLPVSSSLQQRCLNIFRDALKPHSGDASLLQQVKGHLFERNFAAAFGREEYLRVYASRWSSSRALGYLQIFTDLETKILSAASTEEPSDEFRKAFNVVCLGGGAGSELVGLATWYSTNTDRLPGVSLGANMVDSADWDSVVRALHTRTVSIPELSKYASAAAKEAQAAMLSPEKFHAYFQHTDVLDWPETAIIESLGSARLVTIMFTLNELYSTSIPKTQQLLSNLTAAMLPGALLLVVDSPGSYSTVSINGAEKKYPMKWLLDLTLLGPPPKADAPKAEAKWEKTIADDSRWFRLPQGLQYPIELENMRYQIHLYRRLDERG